jgi:hypothetical protein
MNSVQFEGNTVMPVLRRRIITVLLVIGGLVVLVEACSPELTFRAYLSPDLFQPFRRSFAGLTRSAAIRQGSLSFHTQGIPRVRMSGPIGWSEAGFRDLLYSSTRAAYRWLHVSKFRAAAVEVVQTYRVMVPRG